jgi:hypothetical protein
MIRTEGLAMTVKGLAAMLHDRHGWVQRSGVELALQGSIFDVVGSYDIVAMWQARLAHLGVTTGDDGGWRLWRTLLFSSGQHVADLRVLR